MYLAIKEAKRFLKDTEKKFNKANIEGLKQLAENGEIEVRYSQHLHEVQSMAVRNYIKIANELLDRMENAKNDN